MMKKSEVTNDWMMNELLEIIMEQCPFEIPEGEEEVAKEALKEALLEGVK